MKDKILDGKYYIFDITEKNLEKRLDKFLKRLYNPVLESVERFLGNIGKDIYHIHVIGILDGFSSFPVYCLNRERDKDGEIDTKKIAEGVSNHFRNIQSILL